MMTVATSVPPSDDGTPPVDFSPIALLETIGRDGKYWNRLAPRYGVSNPEPPWKTSLSATCDCLAVGGALAALDRRRTEDQLSETVYNGVPAPERQLLALVHAILTRGLIAEDDLADRMNIVRARLKASEPQAG